jgi:hypothetical protein
MTTLELKTCMQERIERLDDTQLKRLHNIFEEEFAGEIVERDKAKKRKLGTMPGLIKYMAPDFDEPLEDFREYLPD